MAIESLIVGQLKTNCYLFYHQETRESFIIDPGDEAEFIINKIKDLGLKPKAILATHGHFDHILAATELKLAFNLPFYLASQDQSILARTQSTANFFTGLNVDPPPTVDSFLTPNQVLKLSGLNLKVLATPGHTPGGVSFYSQKQNLVFVGDLVFSQGRWGRTDLAGGSEVKIKQSIKKILSLPLKTIIYPGHEQATTVRQERKYYPELLK